jgi:putative transcriptional regulator
MLRGRVGRILSARMASPDPAPPLLPARGHFLVASPRLLDPNFMHAVVLLCDHGPQGSYGVIVNRRGDLTLSDLGSDAPLLKGRGDAVWFGGPVGVEQLQVLHGLGDTVPGSLSVLPGVQLGGDPVVLKKQLSGKTGNAAPTKFVVGYSGWGARQLDGELREGAWVVCPANTRLVFDAEPGTLWRRVLRARGAPYADLADIPPDPTWN